ncbi:type II toxin-antitoxin system VapC family toxin [Nocardioides marmoriginsengisoli]|uniref:type II toxin-antitoxin system VapC family toxin n=1 Tax=Nocardioides marmoriginsengisoli TaxID=661483 RepID=UPI001FE9F717|nr:type II toxin-antitoxin system VapC family toxin [Nocardioides marmoriginsengisoli]
MVDASALVNALTFPNRFAPLRERLTGAGSLHAPHLVDSEVQSALRGMVAGRKVSPVLAQHALAELGDLTLARYPAAGLAHDVWALRSRITTYDATYVALAARLDCPLVTCDRKLARSARGIPVEVF